MVSAGAGVVDGRAAAADAVSYLGRSSSVGGALGFVAGLGGVLPLASNSHYPLFYTSDGLYHWGMEWARSPKCGTL